MAREDHTARRLRPDKGVEIALLPVVRIDPVRSDAMANEIKHA
jgi:hypothetical protein